MLAAGARGSMGLAARLDDRRERAIARAAAPRVQCRAAPGPRGAGRPGSGGAGSETPAPATFWEARSNRSSTIGQPGPIQVLLLAPLLLAGCSTATLEQVEEVGQHGARADPGLERGANTTLDDDLCWQGPPSPRPVRRRIRSRSARLTTSACASRAGPCPRRLSRAGMTTPEIAPAAGRPARPTPLLFGERVLASARARRRTPRRAAADGEPWGLVLHQRGARRTPSTTGRRCLPALRRRRALGRAAAGDRRARGVGGEIALRVVAALDRPARRALDRLPLPAPRADRRPDGGAPRRARACAPLLLLRRDLRPRPVLARGSQPSSRPASSVALEVRGPYLWLLVLLGALLVRGARRLAAAARGADDSSQTVRVRAQGGSGRPAAPSPSASAPSSVAISSFEARYFLVLLRRTARPCSSASLGLGRRAAAPIFIMGPSEPLEDGLHLLGVLEVDRRRPFAVAGLGGGRGGTFISSVCTPARWRGRGCRRAFSSSWGRGRSREEQRPRPRTRRTRRVTRLIATLRSAKRGAALGSEFRARQR